MDASDVVTWGQDQQVTSTVVVACMAFVTYDYFLTLEQEIRYVWYKPWNPAKCLFLVIRYLVFFYFPVMTWDYVTRETGDMACRVTEDWIVCFGLAGILISFIPIGLRTWAIWNRSRLCAALILPLFLAILGYGLYVGFDFRNGFEVESETSAPVPGCMSILYQDSIVRLQTLYIVFSVYESVILILTVVRGIQHLRTERANLTSVLYRDAFIASTLQCGTSIASAIMSSELNSYWFSYSLVLQAMTAVVPCRIILNIREAAYTLDSWDMTSGICMTIATDESTRVQDDTLEGVLGRVVDV